MAIPKRKSLAGTCGIPREGGARLREGPRQGGLGCRPPLRTGSEEDRRSRLGTLGRGRGLPRKGVRTGAVREPVRAIRGDGAGCA